MIEYSTFRLYSPDDLVNEMNERKGFVVYAITKESDDETGSFYLVWIRTEGRDQ